MTDEWPYPGDSPVARARRMALAYRAIAESVASSKTKDLDQRFRSWGETWVGEEPVELTDDDYVNAKVGAALIGITSHALSKLRQRTRIDGKWNGARIGFTYRVGDIYKLSTELRGRGWGRTVKVSDNGRGDSE